MYAIVLTATDYVSNFISVYFYSSLIFTLYWHYVDVSDYNVSGWTTGYNVWIAAQINIISLLLTHLFLLVDPRILVADIYCH